MHALRARSELVGTRYRPRRSTWCRSRDERRPAWRVYRGDFVSADDGTGIVHLAPAFGADDYAAGQKHGLPMLRPVDDAAQFLDEHAAGGRHVREGRR